MYGVFNFDCFVVGCFVVYVEVVILITKEGVKFSTKGDIGTTNIVCKQNTSMDKVRYCFPSHCFCSTYDFLA